MVWERLQDFVFQLITLQYVCVKKRTRCLSVLIISGLCYLRYLKFVILYFRLNLNNRILFVFSSEE